MAHEVIQGDWDDLVNRVDLHGRRVRVIILDDPDPAAENPWLKILRAWADSHRPVGHLIDDTRQSIYAEMIDDPR